MRRREVHHACRRRGRRLAAHSADTAGGEDVSGRRAETRVPDSITPQRQAFEQGLREEGFVEGRNLIFERRFAEGTSSACRPWQPNLSG